MRTSGSWCATLGVLDGAWRVTSRCRTRTSSSPGFRRTSGRSASSDLDGLGDRVRRHRVAVGRLGREDRSLRQDRRRGKRLVAEVEELQHRIGGGVAPGERGQSEPGLDEAEDRSVVVDDVRDKVRARVRRDDYGRYANAVSVEDARYVPRLEHGWNVVGRHRCRRRDVIVVAAVLVIGEEQSRRAPLGTAEETVDNLRRELLAHLDVRGRVLIVLDIVEWHEDRV